MWLGGVVIKRVGLVMEIAGSIPAAALSIAVLGKLETYIDSVTKQYIMVPA